ncbi:hypothetical protein EUX98_g5680 [Antrodiella citrinella]|uniref:Uncharacterized protein n=1 Tax=Antrodiella citrinella TaxID=2447956 RepID=A0A4S4MTM7_9APHY|nr:hypothetical protein EUX98_g5680 [Antrodiella citrinella]
MASFSWSDGFQAALAPCLACLNLQRNRGVQLDESDDDQAQHQPPHQHVPARARPDELEGLLADSDDAETHSLHSNLGGDQGRRRRRKRKQPRGIRVFGYDLFGKPPIHLTDDEDESPSALGPGRPRPRPRANDDRSRTISTDTLDSDAAQLDAATIDEMSAARIAEGIKREEEERRLKEERRKLRRERKELKKAALQLALAQAKANGGAGFEGFQGSGPEHGHIPSPFRHTDGSDMSSPRLQEECGPFEHAQLFQAPIVLPRQELDDAEMDGADFGAENYARRATDGNNGGGGSDSRSATTSNTGSSSRHTRQYSYQSQTQHPPPFSPHDPDGTPTQPRKKSRKSGRHSISTTSQSTGSGPLSPPLSAHGFPQPKIATPENVNESQRLEDVEGFGDQSAQAAASAFPSTGLLRGGGGMRRKNSEAGVFLARRGDD